MKQNEPNIAASVAAVNPRRAKGKMILFGWFAAAMMMSSQLYAQQDYFVFIQEPAGQPFYVRMGETSYSSSAVGHLILSSLQDSTYRMFIGFPKSRYPEQMFNIEVSKDRGFELKMVDGRWQLLDLNTKQPLQPVITRRLENMVRKDDDYSKLMAGVVKDSAVLYTKIQDTVIADSTLESQPGATPATARANESRPRAEAPAPGAPDSAVNISPDPATVPDTTAGKKQPAQPSQVTVTTGVVRDRRDIIRYSTENIVGGKLMIYLDRSGEVTDTIRIIVPKL